MFIFECVAVGAMLIASEVGDSTAIRDVVHTPVQPTPNVAVLVTARLPAGVSKATLKLQAVEPAKYIRKDDPSYEKEWIDLTMRDDGQEGDRKLGDSIFSVRVPENYQRHRWLLRYRITAVDNAENRIQAPAIDAPSPNFAWWCDAGPAPWTGSREPGKSPPLTFSKDFLNTLQTIHLIANGDDVAHSQWDIAAHRQKRRGTIVYRGVVYDHIQYSNRGQASGHMAGKNKWGLKFNKGQQLSFYDHDGIRFLDSFGSLNLNPGGSTPYIPVHRGITGLDEVLSLRTYRLAGVPTPPATWIQWRVVTGEEEVDPKNQHHGDLWGPYVAIGEMDPTLLSDHQLPDGLTVSIQSGIKHTPRGMVDASQEWERFLNGMRSNPDEAWWRTNLDLPAYFSFHALNRLLANVDLRTNGNHGYYRHPDGHWAPIPWDLDMMFVPRHHQSGTIAVHDCLSQPLILIEYRNRAREILDLFASDAKPRGGQVGQLVADLGSVLMPEGFDVDWPRLDDALWNQHPRMQQRGTYFINPYDAHHGGGAWKRTLVTNDFVGFQKYLVDFCTDSRPVKNYAPNDGDHLGYGWGYLNHEARDDQLPVTPTVERLKDGLTFKASAFASPAGKQPVSLEWRVGRVGQRGAYELDHIWRKEVASSLQADVPRDAMKLSGDYRVRARWRDDTGRTGHWSLPVVVRIQ